KSSVVLAGLVPKLEQDGNWKYAHFRPGDEPFHSLVKALLPLYMPELDRIERTTKSRELAAELAQGSVPLKDIFSDIESNYSNFRVLLIADQFEELFTLCADEQVRQSFLDLLLACFQSTPQNLQSPPVLVTTMRADFLGQALAYRPLANVLNSDIKLGAMNREELLEVIIQPAALLGVEFESGLVERILDDVEDEPGNLALLEFALTELWQERTDNILTHQAYEKIGKVEGALAEYAEQQYQKLSATEREQARQIFIQLVNLGENNNNTRRRVNREQIVDANWELVTRKQGLADNRLVVTSLSDEEQETLEVVHEALIRHWSRLNVWLNEDQENLSKKRKIEDAAQEWDESNQKTDYLLFNKRLRAAKEFQQEQSEKYPLSDLATSFVARSKKQQIREKMKSLTAFLIIPLIGTATGVYFFVREIPHNADKEIIKNCQGQEGKCQGRLNAVKRLAQAGRSLRYDLSGANLSGAALVGANFEGVNLIEASLNGASLNGANFKNAALSDANLIGANLIGVDFIGASLINANLKGAFLQRTNLNRVQLFGANLEGAALVSANLEGANLISTNLNRVYLNGSNLKDAYLNSANLSGAALVGANLNGANLSGANLMSANLIYVENLTLRQIKSACNWKHGIYEGKQDKQTFKWLVDEKANQEFIEKLKQDRDSDPEEKVDCSKWEEK
ncbi:MAG: pentapeptide repeat-containing protein, partial [Cyanobacteria bacterium J06643_13]